MRIVSALACTLLLVGCAGTDSGAKGELNVQSPIPTVTTEPTARSPHEISEKSTCHVIIGDDGGAVVKAVSFLTEMTEINESTVAQATTIRNALDGAASTSSVRFQQLLTIMKEPFDDFIDSYDKGVTFEFVAERFKTSTNEVLEVCGTLISSPALEAPTSFPSSTPEALSNDVHSENDAGNETNISTESEARKKAEADRKAKAAEEVRAKEKAETDAKAKEEARLKEKAEAEAIAKEEAELGTTSQQNARRLAEDYLDYSAFSRKGLINQLKYEDFSVKDATWALDHMSVDWNAQAVAMAKDYLEYTAFSKKGLTDQLIYEGFTPKQAQYGVSKTGL